MSAGSPAAARHSGGRPGRGRAFVRALAGVLAWAAASSAAAEEAAVYALVAERLSMMEAVAAWKRAAGAPVEDRAREAVVLDRAVAGAAAAGLDPVSVRPFFRAQIEAAKAIQTCSLARWDAGGAAPPADPPDLAGEIRPQLLAMGEALVAALAATLAAGGSLKDRNALERRLAGLECLEPMEVDAIHAALSGVRLSP